MRPINVLRALTKLLEDYSGGPETPISIDEEELATNLKEIILQCSKGGLISVDMVSDLVFHETCGIDENICYDEREDPDFKLNETGDCVEDEDMDVGSSSDNQIPQEKKNEVLDYWKNTKSGALRKWSSMQARYRFLSDRRQLYRWQRQRDFLTRQQKYKIVSDHTLERFREAHVSNRRPVHDRDLQKWAFQKAKEIDCVGFKASRFWLHTFKRKHRIRSRKITKFVTKSNVVEVEDIENAAIAFQLENAPLVKEIGPENCINADQSGFNLLMHGGRTLEFEGVKKVEIIAQSKNALTHSYTVFPMMSASGKLIGPLYLVLQEPDGTFGPQVSRTMFRPNNIFISASKSGKMGASHLDEWVQKVFVPSTGPITLLAVDSWSIFTEENLKKSIPDDKDVRIIQIPAGATGLIQQWDVYGFRFWKAMSRHITDHIMLHDLPISMFQRDNIIKLQSLIYNQLSSPRYEAVFQYSWWKSGLLETRPPKFQNPVQFGINDADGDCGVCEDGGVTMLRCSWCRMSLCAEHFFIDYHYCENYVPC